MGKPKFRTTSLRGNKRKTVYGGQSKNTRKSQQNPYLSGEIWETTSGWLYIEKKKGDGMPTLNSTLQDARRGEWGVKGKVYRNQSTEDAELRAENCLGS